MEGNIIQLKEYHLNKGASKDHTPVFPMTKASAIEGMSELLKDLKINGVTPTSDISDVNSPEKGKIYYEESTDKYYVYSEDKSSFVELGAGASVDPSDVMPTITQEASEQSGGDNIITFTFPNGETTQVIIKNGAEGAQGNSGYTGAANELEVVNNLKDGGPTAALSAEMGKDLATQTLLEQGSFAEAYTKSLNSNKPFPWLLKDIDKNDNQITKMIWHVGSRNFVDALGADIDWYKNGVVIISEGTSLLRVGKDNNSWNWSGSNNEAKRKTLKINPGINVFSFEDLRISSSDPLGSAYLFRIFEYKSDYDSVDNLNSLTFSSDNDREEGNIKVVDFGGFEVTGVVHFVANTTIERVIGLVYSGAGSGLNNAFMGCTNIKEVEINGTTGTTGTSSLCNQSRTLELVNLKNLYTNFIDFSYCTISRLDMRGVNPVNLTSVGTAPFGGTTVGECIIGDFDTSNIETDVTTFANNGNGIITLVCTTTTPPATNANGYFIAKFLAKCGTIKVPASGETAYKDADYWGADQSKIQTYEDGEY